MPAADPAPTTSLVGTHLGPYRIDERLREGGMGVVYRAFDTRLRREVALKTVRPDVLRNPAAEARLLREARAAAALTHPRVATLLDVDRADGTLFLVFEYLRGPTLREWLQHRQPSALQAVELAGQIAEALAAAHLAGIVHRDIKPENVIVDGESNLKVLDFGLAKLAPRPSEAWSGDGPTALTAEGAAVGTLHYMSPEQLQGLEVDHRTDIFSLGVVLYEMATGTLPFAGGSGAEEIARILRCEPPPPRARNPQLPAALEAVVLRCLRREPAERYATARDLLADLAHLRRSMTSGGSATAAEPEYRLARGPARALFLLVQLAYLAMYLAAFLLAGALGDGLAFALGGRLGGSGIGGLVGLVLVLAMVGIGVRLYLVSLVGWDHVKTGIWYRQGFPFFLLLDALWAATPLALLESQGLVALAAVAPLAFAPFSQRTLVRSCYDARVPRRVSSGP